MVRSLVALSLLCSAVAVAAPAKHPTASLVGTREKDPTGGGECFDISVKNDTKKDASALTIAVYAYDKAGAQIGAVYESEGLGFAAPLKPGADRKFCVSKTSAFKGDIDAVEVLVYSVTFTDKTHWGVTPPKAKKKGVALKE